MVDYDIFHFMGDHPILTFFLAFMVLEFLYLFIRHLNIRRHGWPPPHCDADGDFNEEEGGN
ncbi:MAG: hypothetical protein KC587_17515 [Nitrospira sp.]|nr:hypothetical protein [Nitrospira sp.]